MDDDEPDGVLAMAWCVLAYAAAGVIVAVVVVGLAVLSVRATVCRWWPVRARVDGTDGGSGG
jgi:hypothetical protein